MFMKHLFIPNVLLEKLCMEEARWKKGHIEIASAEESGVVQAKQRKWEKRKDIAGFQAPLSA